MTKAQAPGLRELILTELGGKVKPGQLLECIATAPALHTLYLPPELSLTPEVLSLLRAGPRRPRGVLV